MAGLYKAPSVRVDNYGRVITTPKAPDDFTHIVGERLTDIVLFDNSNDELKESGAVILPRNYFVFVGSIDGEIQYKPYEFNQYRIVVATYKGIVTSVDSIG